MGNNEEGRIPPAAYASADLAFNLNLPSANNVNNEAVEFLKETQRHSMQSYHASASMVHNTDGFTFSPFCVNVNEADGFTIGAGSTLIDNRELDPSAEAQAKLPFSVKKAEASPTLFGGHGSQDYTQFMCSLCSFNGGIGADSTITNNRELEPSAREQIHPSFSIEEAEASSNLFHSHGKSTASIMVERRNSMPSTFPTGQDQFNTQHRHDFELVSQLW
jgi:hypothetical protein